jgi:hypothetical protein
MATRQARLAEFPSDPERPPARLFEVLCEDHNGTYLLPFLCRWHDHDWWNVDLSHRVDAKVIGWRAAQPR